MDTTVYNWSGGIQCPQFGFAGLRILVIPKAKQEPAASLVYSCKALENYDCHHHYTIQNNLRQRAELLILQGEIKADLQGEANYAYGSASSGVGIVSSRLMGSDMTATSSVHWFLVCNIRGRTYHCWMRWFVELVDNIQ